MEWTRTSCATFLEVRNKFVTFSKNASSGLSQGFSQGSRPVFRPVPLICSVCLTTAVSSCFQLVCPSCPSNLSVQFVLHTVPARNTTAFGAVRVHGTPDLHSCRTFFAWDEPFGQRSLATLALCVPHNPKVLLPCQNNRNFPVVPSHRPKADVGRRMRGMSCFLSA